MLYTAILAGGVGTRLWPLSTELHPKQFCVLSGERSLLQVTVDRLNGLVPLESIYILTPTNYLELARQHLIDLPDDCFLVEPGGCGTSGALGIAAAAAMQRDPEAVIVSLAADLYFGEEEMLREALRLGESLAQRGEFVTLAVPPAWPETGYGYIETGEELETNAYGLIARRAQRYVEKPSIEEATSMYQSGHYLWHTGIFVSRADQLLNALASYSPTLTQSIQDAARKVAKEGHLALRKEDWSWMDDGIPIEKTVLERAPNVVAIEIPGSWSDLGSWTQVAGLHEEDSNGNTIWLTSQTKLASQDVRSSFVHSTTGRPIALVGMRDYIAVDTAAGLLICHKSQAQQVRHIVAKLHAHPQSEQKDG